MQESVIRVRLNPYTISAALAVLAAGAQVAAGVPANAAWQWLQQNLRYPWNVIVVVVIILFVVGFTVLVGVASMNHERSKREAAASAAVESRLRPEDHVRLAQRLRSHYQRCQSYDLRGKQPISSPLAPAPGLVESSLAMALFEGDPFPPSDEAGRERRQLDISQAYRMVDRHLLVLGRPGVGKSVLLVDLADKLLRRAEPEARAPLPVIFYVAAWTPKYSDFSAWLAKELHETYGEPESAARAWVDESQILPLLDGLDELRYDWRALCAGPSTAISRTVCRSRWSRVAGRTTT